MTTRLATILIGIILLTAPTLSAQVGLALMKVEPGARPAGMGGAFTAVVDGPNSSPYNPAAVTDADKFTTSLGHNSYWDNIRIETGYFATSLTGRSWLHGGIRFAKLSELEERSGPSSAPDNIFDAHDVSFKGGLAFRFAPKITAGFAAGWFMEKIGPDRGSAFNMDFGLLYEATEALSIGAAATNVGSDFQLDSDGTARTSDIGLPTTWRAGGAYRYKQYLGAVDLVYLDEKAHMHIGTEGWLHEYVAVRAGYMINYDTKNLTAGASFIKRNFTVEYAFVPYTSNLGTSHLFNLTVTL